MASSYLAGSTGLEPAASGVTGRRYNHLNYDPKSDMHFSVSDRLETMTVPNQIWWAKQGSNL